MSLPLSMFTLLCSPMLFTDSATLEVQEAQEILLSPPRHCLDYRLTLLLLGFDTNAANRRPGHHACIASTQLN